VTVIYAGMREQLFAGVNRMLPRANHGMYNPHHLEVTHHTTQVSHAVHKWCECRKSPSIG